MYTFPSRETTRLLAAAPPRSSAPNSPRLPPASVRSTQRLPLIGYQPRRPSLRRRKRVTAASPLQLHQGSRRPQAHPPRKGDPSTPTTPAARRQDPLWIAAPSSAPTTPTRRSPLQLRLAHAALRSAGYRVLRIEAQARLDDQVLSFIPHAMLRLQTGSNSTLCTCAFPPSDQDPSGNDHELDGAHVRCNVGCEHPTALTTQ